MSSRKLLFASAVGGFLVCVFASMAAAGDGSALGKKILDANKNAVLKIKLVIQQKTIMNGKEMQSNETKSEATGAVIDPSGLVVASLSSIDPTKLMDSMMKNMGEGMKFEMKYELKDVKLVLPDETEVDAKVVLRDNDWDMAFIRPTQKLVKPLAALDLNNQSQPQVLDDIVIINRMGKVANHVSSAASSKISAIVPKPRLFYVPQAEGIGATGTPVFTMDGKIVGVILMRSVDTHAGGGMTAMLGGAEGMGIMAIILPASEILEASKQALAEPKDEAKDESKDAKPKSE